MSIQKYRPNVLFAIKEELMLRTIREMLRGYGAGEVRHVRSMDDVYKELFGSRHGWEIVIVDGALANAVTVIKKARPEVDSRIKFLLLMSNPTKEDVMEAVDAGVDGFLASPFAPEKFEEKIDLLQGVKRQSPKKSITATVFR